MLGRLFQIPVDLQFAADHEDGVPADQGGTSRVGKCFQGFFGNLLSNKTRLGIESGFDGGTAPTQVVLGLIQPVVRPVIHAVDRIAERPLVQDRKHSVAGAGSHLYQIQKGLTVMVRPALFKSRGAVEGYSISDAVGLLWPDNEADRKQDSVKQQAIGCAREQAGKPFAAECAGEAPVNPPDRTQSEQ